jgi:hypothetical protein
LFSFQNKKEKSKYGYMVRKNLDFDKAEILLYEPVEKMPPFSRKTLVLVKIKLQFNLVPVSELLSLPDPNTSS